MLLKKFLSGVGLPYDEQVNKYDAWEGRGAVNGGQLVGGCEVPLITGVHTLIFYQIV